MRVQVDMQVWWVDLVALSDPGLVPQVVAKSLGIVEVPGVPLIDTIANSLCLKQGLLLLDNCEHLTQACATFADHLLNHTYSLKILATSREALNIKGELIWHVPSLSLPDLKHIPSLEHLTQFEAVQLFIERALLIQPEFSVTHENAPFVAQICSRLDGIPLAIELAAARNLQIMVDHTFLFTGAVKKIHQLIDDSTLGKLYYYDSTRVNLGLFQHDIDVLWDLAPQDRKSTRLNSSHRT